MNPVDRKDANGKKCPGKADQYLQRIPILDVFWTPELKSCLDNFSDVLNYVLLCEGYKLQNILWEKYEKEHFEEFLQNQN